MTKRSGYIKVAKLWGAPVEVLWWLPVIGILLCFVGDPHFRKYGYYCLALIFLVVVHELGHAAMTRLFGLQVIRIDISGLTGRCYIELPKQVRQSALIWSAGLMAQLAVLLLTWVYVMAFGHPKSVSGHAIVQIFINMNIIIFLVNLTPYRFQDGDASDGKVLWDLYRHVYHGHPLPSVVVKALEESPIFPPEQRLLSLPQFRTRDFEHGVEILNDQTTMMQFVLDVLSRHLNLNGEVAIQKMLEIHNRGGVLIPLPTPDEARNAATAITADARAAGCSLICRYADIHEEADSGDR